MVIDIPSGKHNDNFFVAGVRLLAENFYGAEVAYCEEEHRPYKLNLTGRE